MVSMGLTNNKKSTKLLFAFGLLEVMISAMILSIGLLGIASMQSRAVNTAMEADRKETAYRLARQLINFIQTTNNTTWLSFITNVRSAGVGDQTEACLHPASCGEDDYYLKSILLGWQQNIVNKMLPSGQSYLCAVDLSTTQSQRPKSIKLRIAIRWTKLSGSFDSIQLDSTIIVDVPSSISNSISCPDSPDSYLYTAY